MNERNHLLLYSAQMLYVKGDRCCVEQTRNSNFKIKLINQTNHDYKLLRNTVE